MAPVGPDWPANPVAPVAPVGPVHPATSDGNSTSIIADPGNTFNDKFVLHNLMVSPEVITTGPDDIGPVGPVAVTILKLADAPDPVGPVGPVGAIILIISGLPQDPQREWRPRIVNDFRTPEIKLQMSLSCLAIGDPHFKTQNLRYARQMTEKVWSIARSRKPSFIVILGDVLHTNEKINAFAQKDATEFIGDLSREFQVYLLIGNHDRPDNDHYLTDVHPFIGLKYAGTSLDVIDKGLIETIDGRKFVFLPYVPDGRFDDAIRSLDLDPDNLSDVTMLFAHQTFKGAKMGHKIAGTEPGKPVDVWPLTRPPVISGHIHDFAKLQPNLIYTGTPLQHAFGDRDDKTVSFITFNETGFEHERIDLKLPTRRTFRLKPSEVADFTPPIVDDPSLVKIIITGTQGENRALIKSGFTESWSSSGYLVGFKYLKEAKESVDLKQWAKHTTVNKSYRTALLESINTEPGQLSWFNRLFDAS